MNAKPCVYCGDSTLNIIELGRGTILVEIPCCLNCFEVIDELPQSRKDEMADAAHMLATASTDKED